ncbi:hypothetical protein LCGC14_1408960 [marine sediment metagenome]|uniref:Uncharacterized protein n=1 Tax=marine sediment metagenome TaxID=412755 RepID=A0A0F9MWG9_9ZZZZ
MKKIELTYFNNKPIVWLTWAERENGLIELRAVSLTEKHAEYSLGTTKEEVTRQAHNKVIRVWSEKREAEHLYGYGMTKELIALARRSLPREGD